MERKSKFLKAKCFYLRRLVQRFSGKVTDSAAAQYELAFQPTLLTDLSDVYEKLCALGPWVNLPVANRKKATFDEMHAAIGTLCKFSEF